MRHLFIGIIYLALVLPQNLLWADALNLDSNGLEAKANSTTFLPVEQAYELFPRREGNHLVLDWVLAPGYYLYKERFKAGVIGGPLDGKALTQSFSPGETRYDDYYEKDVEVYYSETSVIVDLDPSITSGYVKVESQACADEGLCYPPRSQYVSLENTTASLEVLSTLPEDGAAHENTTGPLPVILGFALLGGLILNLMPCVFPVLSIKVLSLSHSHLSSHGLHIHGLVYSLGVVASFVLVATGLITLRAGGEALGWGFQLQSPGFITALAYLFFVMGLSFSGFFEAGTRLMNLGQSSSSGSGLHHSFLTGVLATVVASPCSAPFMGTALGFALTQDTPIALLVFLVLGLGMALPFLVLTWAPSLLGHLPKPGPWMVTLKGFLAFPLYLTAVWLIWILGKQTDPGVMAMVLCGMVLIALAIWLGKYKSWPVRAGAILLVALAVVIPARELRNQGEQPIWQPYTPDRLDELLNEQKPVFINLTADWCITCLANEKLALSSSEFESTLSKEDITYLKGDWTNYDADITTLLNANGRSGVPLYLFYPAGHREPVVLPQILSRSTVTQYLTKKYK